MNSPDRRSATVLSVDDNDASRYTRSRILRRAGFQVLEVSTGEEALRVVRSARPEVVILDVNLPDMPGTDVCRRIKSDPDTASIMVLHVSATAIGGKDQVVGLEAGADNYLLEPLDEGVLVASVEALLRIRRAEEALKEEARRKDEFLAMLAHELRNPLSAILFGLETQRLLPPEHPAYLEAREVMLRKVSHMARLIDDLLDVSRITRGRIELRRGPLDLAGVVGKAVESLASQASGRGLRLELSLPGTPLLVDGDATRLEQVVSNILQNAIKFSETGGIIQLGAREEGGWIELRVRDEGKGISADLLPRIFDLFIQGDSSLDRSQGGLGIGLTLVKKLVDLHGGTIEARSGGPGLGSEFVVRLPVLPALSGSRREERGERTPVKSVPRRILVVEDNQDSADLLGVLLEEQGHGVRVVHDGLAALQQAGEFRPEVVILDIGLPGLDGFEVARRMRKIPGLERSYLVALTGYGQEEDRTRAREAGFDHHLTKPVGVEALEEVLAGLPRD